MSYYAKRSSTVQILVTNPYKGLWEYLCVEYYESLGELRIPIRGYEVKKAEFLGEYTKVTNPYKGLWVS